MKIKEYVNAEMVRSSLANTPQITFEVTDACNLACVYCSYGELYFDYDKRDNKVLDVEKARRFLNYVAELWDSPLNKSTHNNLYLSFYGGEPLLNVPFIDEVVSFANNIKSKQRQFTYSMTTNGLLLDKYVDFLVINDFSLLISLDGNEFSHSYRVNKDGQNSFKHVIDNIEIIRHKYPDYFTKRVNFNTVLHNRNSVRDVYDFFKKNYNKIPSIGALNDMGIREEMKDEFMRMYRNTTDSLMQSENYSELETEMFLSSPTYHSATVYLLQHSEFKYENYNELLYGKVPQKKVIPTGTCLPFSKKVFITVNGKILPCERIGQQFALGCIEEKNIDLNFEAIAQKYNHFYSKTDTLCSECFNSKGCVQCLYNLDDLEEEGEPECKGFMTQEKFDLFRNSQLNFLARHPEAYSKIMNDVIYR
ncbi:MAG TPA: radical SAM peptide maturase [Bacteroidales bacterium]|nr:MAG: radical SAM peptide maturase [Bacteroidetes bacterium GWE2_42_24]OFY26716.1 MAG: radical SAM peptide maturase [Bacteroidetes bacterium GWF2_43_11]HBZ67976.1 radical SAM peptide maturase [Bacteroidales bacterium]